MPNEIEIRPATTEDIPAIGMLAQNIWPVAYRGLLTEDQLQYMLRLFYNPAALYQQMMEKGHHFLMVDIDEEPVGFTSYSAIEPVGTFKLHKLYVRTDIQGKGIGRALIDAVIDDILPLGANSLILNVKRDNDKAIEFYKRLGFSILCNEDIDIGNGYFLVDYRMEKKLT